MLGFVLACKPDLVITEKGLSDFAAHHLQKAGISAIRRLRKTDNNRIARACGATIVNRPEEIKESDVGTMVRVPPRSVRSAAFLFLAPRLGHVISVLVGRDRRVD